jgi:nicotinamide riboside transporter PnuC
MLGWVTTIVCLIGSFLNAKKMIMCFLFWTIGNVLWLYMDIINHNYSRATLDIVQGIITLYGYTEWKKEDYKRAFTRLP